MWLLLNSPQCAGRSESHGRRGDYKSFSKCKRRKKSCIRGLKPEEHQTSHAKRRGCQKTGWMKNLDKNGEGIAPSSEDRRKNLKTCEGVKTVCTLPKEAVLRIHSSKMRDETNKKLSSKFDSGPNLKQENEESPKGRMPGAGNRIQHHVIKM